MLKKKLKKILAKAGKPHFFFAHLKRSKWIKRFFFFLNVKSLFLLLFFAHGLDRSQFWIKDLWRWVKLKCRLWLQFGLFTLLHIRGFPPIYTSSVYTGATTCPARAENCPFASTCWFLKLTKSCFGDLDHPESSFLSSETASGFTTLMTFVRGRASPLQTGVRDAAWQERTDLFPIRDSPNKLTESSLSAKTLFDSDAHCALI